MSTKKETHNFAKTLDELEALTDRLEEGNISIEESIEEFERGIGLIRAAQDVLKQAEQKVKLLLQKDGQLSSEVFQGASDDEQENS
ncbi:MAG: exodeoxyribonuclease VII small subunit [Pseudomonadota bacterium]